MSVNSKQLAVNTNTTYDLLKGNKGNTCFSQQLAVIS